MSSVHLARQGFVTKSALPSVSRERGTTQVADRDTVLLLNGNGTNGAQNNTFLTENFGSASGRGNYSVFFDGTGDSVRTPTSAAVLGTNNWTFECWVYLNAKPSFGQVLGMRKGVATSADQFAPVVLAINSTGFLLYSSSNSSSWNVANGTTFGGTANTNEWYHVAVVRDGSTIYGFLNGVRTTLVTGVSADYTSTNSIFVGGAESTDAVNCYVSNARVVNGTAVYTSAFTPPTSELTAISGTSLLTCQGTVIRDASSNNFAITVNGDAKVASNTSSAPIAITRNGNATQGSFSPFTLPDGQWSNYFDGSSSVRATSTSSAFDITGNFTVEGWYYITATPVVGDFFGIEENTTGYAAAQLQVNTNRTLTLNVSTSGSSWAASTNSTATIALNEWTHIAVVRNGTSVTTYLNGTSIITATVSGSLYSSGAFSIVGGRNAGGYITGYCSNFRFVNGTAVYTSAFTPPTTNLTAITNTSLLTCQSNRFIDKSSNNFTLTATGSPRVTPWSPFAPTSAYDPATNGGSGYFDGTGDFLNIPTSTALDISSGDFTIEGWIYPNSVSGGVLVGLSDGTTISSASQVNSAIFLSSSNFVFRVYIGASFFNVASTSASASEWTHLALVRNGSTFTAYKNGVSVGTYTSSSNLNYGTAWRWGVGSFIGDTSTGQLNGNIANLRVVKGTAVYTANFTPPTAPVTNITNTSLLLNFTNAGIFDTAGDNVIETVGNAKIDTAIKKYGSGSLKFDGNGDMVQLVNAGSIPQLIIGTADCTIEAWIYVVGSGTEGSNANIGAVFMKSSTNGGAANWYNETLQVDATNRTVAFNANTADGQTQVNVTTPNNTISLNTWHHVAFVKSGTTWTIYVDGVNRVSATRQHFGTTTSFFASVGRNANSSSFKYPFNGYIDDLRITNGRARYTANFTPPSSELVVVGSAPNIVNNSTYGVYQLA